MKKRLAVDDSNLNHLRIQIVMVTPKMAADWLAKNRINRRLRENVWKVYANDMLSGHWGLAEAAIFSSDSGDLYNGQHRCTAIVETGVTVPMIVVYGCTEDMIANIDQGKSRSTADAIKLGYGTDAPLWKIACVRTVISGGLYVPKSHHEIHDAMAEYEEELNFLGSHPRIKRVSCGEFDAVVCRALRVGHDRARISEWLTVCHTGEISGPADNAAVRYRDWAWNASTGGWAGRKVAHDRCQAALGHFLLRKPIGKLYPTGGELFRVSEGDEPAENQTLAAAVNRLVHKGNNLF